jgi:hypothetical protein
VCGDLWIEHLKSAGSATELDQSNHRLFVIYRSGQLIVFNTETGKELQAFPVGEFVHDLVFDATNKRTLTIAGLWEKSPPASGGKPVG